MKKSEKILSAFVLMALGVLFVILQDKFIGILMTAAGIGLIVLGGLDCIHRSFPLAIIKIVSGVLLVIAGWTLVAAVLYILSGILLVFGILMLYDKVKRNVECPSWIEQILQFFTPAVCIIIGVLLLFQWEDSLPWMLVISGILTVIEGGALLFAALNED